MPYSLIIDVVVAILLAVTIGYAIVLNRRLGTLRRDKAELEKLATTFADSTLRADDSIGRLKATADMLQKRLENAQALHDDLTFLAERGDKLADRLEQLVRAARDEAGVTPPAKPAPAAQPAAEEAPEPALRAKRRQSVAGGETEPEGEPRSEAERALLRAIRSAG